MMAEPQGPRPGSPVLHAARLGLRRGWLEFCHTLAHPQELGVTVVLSVAFLVVVAVQAGDPVSATTVTLGALTLPGLLGVQVAMGGVLGTAGRLAVEREDGTLLRAKAIPHGMTGFLVARIVVGTLETALSVLLVLVPGLFFVDAVRAAGPGGFALLAGVGVLGLAATLPWGAVAGSLARTPGVAFSMTMLPTTALIAISGIFYPITALPGWVQTLAQVFPFYWLGHGMRYALLPAAAAAAELTATWQPTTAVLVLLAWAVTGLLVAPAILRRMARRESGSAVDARRQKAMQRV